MVAQRRPRREGRPRYYARRRVCAFCVDHVDDISYKDLGRLRRYLSDRAKIEPRRKTGACAKHQRFLARALKRARHLALLPFTMNHARLTGWSPADARPLRPQETVQETTAATGGPPVAPVEAAEGEEPAAAVVAEPEAAVEPEVVAELEVAVEPEAAIEPEVVAEPEAMAESEVVAELEAVAEPETVTEPEAIAESEAVAEPEATVEPEATADQELEGETRR